MKAFVLGGGSMEVSTTKLVCKYLNEEDFEVFETEDAELFLEPAFAESDLLVLNSCLWTGSGHTISSEARSAFVKHLELGKGVVVMHSSIGNWPDWPEYKELIGSAWVWDNSKHSHPDSVFRIERTTDHPLWQGVPNEIEVRDEMYYDLYFAEGNQLIARTTNSFGGHPMAYVRHNGQSRLAAVLIGHDDSSCSDPSYIRLFKNACQWCMRSEE